MQFIVFLVLAWALNRARPDLRVHVVVENAGSMRQEHLAATGTALGINDPAIRAQVIDAAGWASMPRRRTFLST